MGQQLRITCFQDQNYTTLDLTLSSSNKASQACCEEITKSHTKCGWLKEPHGPLETRQCVECRAESRRQLGGPGCNGGGVGNVPEARPRGSTSFIMDVVTGGFGLVFSRRQRDHINLGKLRRTWGERL